MRATCRQTGRDRKKDKQREEGRHTERGGQANMQTDGKNRSRRIRGREEGEEEEKVTKACIFHIYTVSTMIFFVCLFNGMKNWNLRGPTHIIYSSK